MNDYSELLRAGFFIFCCLLVAAGFVAWLLGFVTFQRPSLGAPHRSVFRPGSVEHFRDELRRLAVEPTRDEIEFGDEALPMFLRRQAE